MNRKKESNFNKKQAEKRKTLQKSSIGEKDLSGIMGIGDLSKEWCNSRFISQQEKVFKALKEVKEKDSWLEKNAEKFSLDTDGEKYILLIKFKSEHPILLAELMFHKENLLSKINSFFHEKDLPLISQIRTVKF